MVKMPRFVSAVVLCLLILAGCGALRTYKLNEAFPEPTDPKTLLPLYDAVTVTRTEDGASVTLTAVEAEPLLLTFENIVCTREKAQGMNGAYTVTFVMTDPAAQKPTLVIGEVTGGAASVFEIGGWRYAAFDEAVDLAALIHLFPDA